MDSLIDVSRCRPAAVLAALYNCARPQGMGFLHYTPKPMTEAEAADLLARCRDADGRHYFDYLQGRVMKVCIGDARLSPLLYDRDNGSGAALEALKAAGLDVGVVATAE